MSETSPNPQFSWIAPEFTRHEKSLLWFIIFGVIFLGFFLAALLLKNYFFALLILITAFLVFVQALKHPRQISFEFFDDKIIIDKQLILTYREIVSFWLFADPEINSLRLETKRFAHPRLIIPLGSQDPAELRIFLKKFIKEKEQDEPLLDILMRWIKF